MPSLYIHVPFCIKKCAYCAFYSVPKSKTTEATINNYLKSLQQEIELLKKHSYSQGIYEKDLISTVFIGGGTPSALNEAELEHLLKTISAGFKLGGYDEFERTLEANPKTLTVEKLKLLRNFGINRLSLGAQSFNDKLLKRVNRIHSAEDIFHTVKLVRQGGFNNLNLDLIFGLPEQTLNCWQETLKFATSLNPEHISIYGLMIEENTPLANNINNYKIPSDDLQAEMYHLAREFLKGEGFVHYETSNFAKPGYQCQHNLGYWQGRYYYGLGPGAVSYIKNRRWKNIENLPIYIDKINKGQLPIDSNEDEELSLEDKMTERIILGLRLEQGIDLEQFEKEFGISLLDKYSAIVEKYINSGILIIDKGALRIISNYWFVANGVLQEFI